MDNIKKYDEFKITQTDIWQCLKAHNMNGRYSAGDIINELNDKKDEYMQVIVDDYINTH